jgi:hypothetical protein
MYFPLHAWSSNAQLAGRDFLRIIRRTALALALGLVAATDGSLLYVIESEERAVVASRSNLEGKEDSVSI